MQSTDYWLLLPYFAAFLPWVWWLGSRIITFERRRKLYTERDGIMHASNID